MRRFPRAGWTSLPAGLICLIAALLLGGCSTTIDATTLGVPASLSSAAGQRPAGEAFRINTHAVFGLWGLASLKRPAVDKILASQLVGKTALADVRVRIRSSWSDVLLTVLTAGLIVPRSVTVEGVAVSQ
jgi:hypothetical protein